MPTKMTKTTKARTATVRRKVPRISYDNWTVELSHHASRHGSRIAFGTETHDAWSSGMSPEDYAKTLAGTAHYAKTLAGTARPTKLVAPRDRREQIRITWHAVPNTNTRSGGYMPAYEIDGGKSHGNDYGSGYTLRDAEAIALEMANEEAARYVGDWNVVVSKGHATGDRAPREIEREIKDLVRG